MSFGGRVVLHGADYDVDVQSDAAQLDVQVTECSSQGAH